MPKTTGIIGGTFNPIHIGHLLMAEYARCQMPLDSVIFIPNHIPPHKSIPEHASSEDRYLMTFLATYQNKAFTVSRMEMERRIKSYTYDTIAALKNNKTAPKHLQKTDFVFICGADTLIKHKWYKFPELLELLKAIIVAPRYGASHKEVVNNYSTLPKKLLKKIVPLETPFMDISSSMIRERIAGGKSIKYLVPSPVENYIIKQNLYKNGN